MTSSIRRGFAPGFVDYKKGCTRLAAASDKAYQLLAHGRWFSPGTPASSTTKSGRHDIAEILLNVELNTKRINQSINQSFLICSLLHQGNLNIYSIYVWPVKLKLIAISHQFTRPMFTIIFLTKINLLLLLVLHIFWIRR